MYFEKGRERVAKGSTGTSMGGSIEYVRLPKKKKQIENPPEKKRGACLNCAYYYQASCTFDGTPNPDKAWCENFVSLRRSTKKDKKEKVKEQRTERVAPIPCDCQKCINWRGAKGCRLQAQSEIKDGKCRYYGTFATSGYATKKEERKAIIAHNKAVDAAKAAARKAPTPVVKLATLRKVCECNFTMEGLRQFKRRVRPGNGRYEIECVNEDPLTIKVKGMTGSRKPYIVEE